LGSGEEPIWLGGEAVSSIYRKQTVLGWGSWSLVSSGRDEMQGRIVAIKELARPFAGNTQFARAYFAKARKMLGISHPNLLTTYAVDSEGDTTRVIRDLAENTLGSQLIRGPLAVEEVVLLLRHLLPALEALHQRDILHGALKPENIFLCEEDFKLGDFGLPLVSGAPPPPPRRLRYSSPEEKDPDLLGPASDLYSLGVVAYELLLGPIRLEEALNDALTSEGLGASEGAIHRDVDELWWQFHVSSLEFPLIHELDLNIPVALSLTLQRMVRKLVAQRAASCKEVLMALGPAETAPRKTPARSIRQPEESKQIVDPPESITASLTAPTSRPWRSILARGAAAVLLLWVGGYMAVWRSSRPTEPISSGSGLQLAAPVRQSLFLGLESERSGSMPPRVSVKTPLLFRVTSDRKGYLLLYGASSDGSITCLYPSARRASLEIAANETFILPLSQDREQGFALVATAPAGQESIFLLRSAMPLPALPPTGQVDEWLRQYSTEKELKAFHDWLALLKQDPGQEIRLSQLDIEITP
jgi:serine/threonine protein kinase